MVLKPQDVYVALKIASSKSDRAPYAQLAAELFMSPSEVHASVQRAQEAHLLHSGQLKNRPNFAALEEFLVHGLKYAFPATRGGPLRGLPTSYAAEPLLSMIAPGSDPVPVWPTSEGKQRGMAFEPLHRGAPQAALHDPVFYEYLILADALRDGRIRERKLAASELHRRFREPNVQSKSEATDCRRAALAAVA